MLAYASDYIVWGAGMTFISPNTVMPTFLRHFTDSPVIIGLVNTIQTGGWLLPQLLVSNLIAHRRRKKPIMIGTGLIYRHLPWLFALFLFLNPSASGETILWVFFLGYIVFNLGDAISTVPWFDIMGKSVPPERRGRMMGAAQVVASLVGIGVGQLVKEILAPGFLPFPHNYALLFGLAGIGVMGSWLVATLIHEVEQPVAEERMAFKEYLPALTRVLRHDRHFRNLMIARLIGGMANMALPFYILFGTDELHFAPETVGLFISAQVLGGLAAGTVLGYLSERSGSKAVILTSFCVQMLAPLTALAVFAAGGGLGDMAPWVYALVFVAVGFGQSSGILGFINYVLELAQPQERVTYVGLTNTLSGILAIAPLIGAALVGGVSYVGLFIAVIAVLAAAFASAVSIAEPRQLARQPQTP